MKKFIIVSVIIFCILFFLEIPCLAINEAHSPSQMWNSLDDNAKVLYICGIREGIVMCMEQITEMFLVTAFKDKNVASIIEDILKNYDQFVSIFNKADDFKIKATILKTVVSIISDLYKDPSNAFINVSDMCLLSSRKLRGESIETSLIELRKKALP